MNLNTRKLRIKAKHLAEEARIIRREAKLVHGLDRYNLNYHRTWDVRNEARATQLAYQFLRGKRRYSEIEGPRTDTWFRKLYIDVRIKAMVRKYGSESDLERLDNWMAEKSPAAGPGN